MELKTSQVLLILVFFVAISGSAAADSSNWNLEALSEPHDLHDVSDNTTTVQLLNLTDSDSDPVDADRLSGDDANLSYIYNQTGGSEFKMEHLSNGYYYANFTVNSTKGFFVEYELEDDSSDGFEDNRTDVLNAGNLTVDILTDFSGTLNPDESVDLKVNVTDEWNDTFENDNNLDVDLYMTNGSHTLDIKDLNNKDTNELFWKNFGASFSIAHGTTYILHANATFSGASYSNANGSESILVDTDPELLGEINDLNASSGCNNESFFNECERSTTLDTKYNITSASADDVEFEILLVNKSNSEWFQVETTDLSDEGDLWEGSLETPDINTSKHEKKYILRYNASRSDGGNFVQTRNVSYRSYKIQDKSSPTANQGDSYEVEILLGQYFSLKSLDSSRFKNASIDILEPDSDSFESFNLSDMSYDSSSGLFSKSINIPADAETGSYDTDITAFNIYGEKKEKSSGFNVNSVDASFNTSGDIEHDINKTGIHEINFTVTNKLGSQRTLEVLLKDDIENFTEVNDGDNITLEADEKRNVTVDFNITYVDDYDGEINLTDNGNDYSSAIEVDIDDGVDCDLREETLCIEGTSDWENVTSSEKGHVTRNIDVIYLGGKNNTSATFESSVSGDVSSYLSIEPSTGELNSTWDRKDVTLNYSVETPGNFTGGVEFWIDDYKVSFNTSLEADIDSTDTGISVTDAVDLGYMATGDPATAEIEVENTGSVEITTLSVSSTEYEVSMESTSVSTGETVTRELDFTSVETDSGSVTVTGENSEGDLTGTVSVTANPVPNYAEQTSTLETRIQDLTAQTSSESTKTRLQELSTELSNIETLYEQEEYRQAEESYQNVQSELDSIESQISGGAPTSPDGEPGTEQPDQTGGGPPVVPIVLGLAIILLIGFIAYTSLIPEEGDPLYGLLGEE